MTDGTMHRFSRRRWHPSLELGVKRLSPDSSAAFTVKSGAAAAIVTTANLTEEQRATVADPSRKFSVHPHIATITAGEALLRGYLEVIYTGERVSLGAEYPTAGRFSQLASLTTVAEATRLLAEAMAEPMSARNANPGILFGFLLELADGSEAHGVIKADLDDEQRFHFRAGADNSWSIDEVRDILPPPRAKFAKFAIAPQPLGAGPVGVHDKTDLSSAADYFLTALGLSVPRTKGTQAAVAREALAAGYSHTAVRNTMKTVTADTPVDDFVEEKFPEIPDTRRATLRGSASRPMPVVREDDPYLMVYRTKNPHFELVVDVSVDVDVQGNVITITLPEGSDLPQIYPRQ